MHFSVAFFQNGGPPGSIITHLEWNWCRRHLEHGKTVIDDYFLVGTLMPQRKLKNTLLRVLALRKNFLQSLRMLSDGGSCSKEPAVTQKTLTKTVGLKTLFSPEAWGLLGIHIGWSGPIVYLFFEHWLGIILILDEFFPVKWAWGCWEEGIFKFHRWYMRDHRVLSEEESLDAISARHYVARLLSEADRRIIILRFLSWWRF